MSSAFHQLAIRTIRQIPIGKVASYGQIAALTGSPRAARQVVRVLHSSSDKEKLPWHRVINSQGRISLKPGQGYELQKAMLESEGVLFRADDSIDMSTFQWIPTKEA